MSNFPLVIDQMIDDVVARLKDRNVFLSPGLGGTCDRVGDASLFTSFGQIPTPFAFVQYAGEDSQAPENLGGAPLIQQISVSFQVWLGAISFSLKGDTQGVPGGNVGLNTLIDAAYESLTGYLFPVDHTGCWSKLYHASTTPPVVEDHRVISIQTWRASLVRQQVGEQ